MRRIIVCFTLLAGFRCSLEPSHPHAWSLDESSLVSDKALVNTSNSAFAKLSAVGIDEVRLTDGFWHDRVNTAIHTMIPEMWTNYTTEVSHALSNFEIAAGLKDGEHKGAPFHDGDFYKLIEAVSMAYAITKDEKFERMIDEVIPLIRGSQREDGYIHTPVMIEAKNNPEGAKEFRDRMDFESYNIGHLITAAIVHFKATGKTSLLECAIKAADYLYSYTTRFPEKMAKNAICPSHYMAVVELYRTTRDPKYLELAKQFIAIRSLMEDGTDHNQDRIPFREQTKAVGHAVRANYLYAGVADVYAETGDGTLMTALDSIWNDLTSTKLYITGGCGALYDGVSPNGTTYKQSKIQQVHQAYGREYELPNAGAHNETCANIGSVLWNWRMLQTTGEAKYADLMETTLLNSVLSGVNLNGKGYFYTNPLSHQMDLPYELRWPNVRQPYISKSNCCPPNLIRTIMEVGSYLYSKDHEGLWFNMYTGNELTTNIGNETLNLSMETNYPWDGVIEVLIKQAPGQVISLNFRIPDWCEKASLSINNRSVTAASSNGYLTLRQPFHKGDRISLKLEMPVVLVEANPLVEANRNQVAVKRGPLVYCLEGNDLEDGYYPANVLFPIETKLIQDTMLIDDVKLVTLKGKARYVRTGPWQDQLYKKATTQTGTIPITLIPYFAWANREENDMAVWLALDR